MAMTNFGQLTDEQLTIWKRDLWKAARDYMFLGRFMGDTSMSMIQRITELKQSEKGARAVITLVADLEGDGVAGDRTLKGNEEAGKSHDQVIRIDQLRHAQKSEGRMAEQKSIVNFRETARDVLAFWLADRSDQLAFLTLSGVAYSFNTDGTARVGSDLPYLEFAADVTAPSTNRHRRWDATTGLEAADTAAVDAADKPSYDMLVEMKAFAKNNFMRPIRGEQGLELYNVFMTPDGIAKLKQDSKFHQAWRDAMPRAKDNPLFKGADVIYVDGLAIYEYRHVFHSDTWGAASNVSGQRVLMCGAQALAYADIGDPSWVEETDDYKNQQGIATGKIMGMKKPVFRSRITSSNEDFSVLCVDTAR